MHLSRLVIKNFRNFRHIDVPLSGCVVVVGENATGKSNLLHALRLLLDPSLPDSARNLRREDRWDGAADDEDASIEVSVEVADFEDNPGQLALLASYLVEPEPMVSRLTYVWRPRPGLGRQPTRDADYEWFIYGGDRQDTRVHYETRRRLPIDVLAALRDAESDLARWGRSPLRPLLDAASADVSPELLLEVAKNADEAFQQLLGLKPIQDVADSINSKIEDMVGTQQRLGASLNVSSTDADRLIRGLRLFIDSGKRTLSEASLGGANVLYLALKLIEYDRLVADNERDHTFLAIEEPEAHLHPSMQRSVFRSYLSDRETSREGAAEPFKDDATSPLTGSTTVLLTTHSPHIASVAPVRSIVSLRRDAATCETRCRSTAKISLSSDELRDLQRYLDVTRGELLFARAAILVEGDSERFLLPAFARSQNCDLDKSGVVIASVAGTNFAPFVKLLGPSSLDIPFAVLTDFDPTASDSARGLKRLRHLYTVVEPDTKPPTDDAAFQALAEQLGLFVNEDTFEIELVNCGLAPAIASTLKARFAAKQGSAAAAAIEELEDDHSSEVDRDRLLELIERIGKVRFAQSLYPAIENDRNVCPPYIAKALAHVCG